MLYTSSMSRFSAASFAALFLLAASLVIVPTNCLVDESESSLLHNSQQHQQQQQQQQQELVIYSTENESIRQRVLQQEQQQPITKTPPGGDPNLVYYTVFFNYTFQLLTDQNPVEKPNAMQSALKTVETAVLERVNAALVEYDYDKRVIVRVTTSHLVETCPLTEEEEGGRDGGYIACSLAKTSLKTKVDTTMDEARLDRVVYLDVQKFVQDFNRNHTGHIKAIYGGPISVSAILVLDLEGTGNIQERAMSETELQVFEESLFNTYQILLEKSNNPGFILDSIKVLLQESASSSSRRRRRQQRKLGGGFYQEDAAGETESDAVRVEVYVRGTCSHGFAQDKSNTTTPAAAAEAGDVGASSSSNGEPFSCTDQALGDYTRDELAFFNALFLEKLKFQGEQRGVDYFADLTAVNVMDNQGNSITESDVDTTLPNSTNTTMMTIEEEENPQWIWILIGLALGISACGLCVAMIMVTTRYQQQEERRRNRANHNNRANATTVNEAAAAAAQEKNNRLNRDHESYTTRQTDNRQRRGSGGQRRGSGGSAGAGAGAGAASTVGGAATAGNTCAATAGAQTGVSEEDIRYDFEQHNSEHDDDDFDEEFSCSYDEAIACGAAAAHAAENPEVMEHSFPDLDTIVTNESHSLRRGGAPPSPLSHGSRNPYGGQQQQQQQHHHNNVSNNKVEHAPSVRPIAEDPDVYFD